jgi:hypothetical protein
MTAAAHLTWASGGEAHVLSASADAIVLQSTVSSPPGSRIEGVLRGEAGRKVRVKVHSCRKEADGRFRIEGRPVDLTREAREELVGLTRVMSKS